jgi:hypothetical protein
MKTGKQGSTNISFCETNPSFVLGPFQKYESCTWTGTVCFESLQGGKQPAIRNGPHRHTLKTRLLMPHLDNNAINEVHISKILDNTLQLCTKVPKVVKDFTAECVPLVGKNKYFPCPGCLPERILDFAQGSYANNYQDSRMILFAKRLKKCWRPGKQVIVTAMKHWRCIQIRFIRIVGVLLGTRWNKYRNESKTMFCIESKQHLFKIYVWRNYNFLNSISFVNRRNSSGSKW